MDNQVAIRQPDAIARPQSFEAMLQMADTLVKSGFLPSAIKTAPQAAAIMVAGREIGLTAMQSFRELYVVNGQVGMSTRLIMSLFKQYGGSYTFLERTPDKCTIRLTGPDGSQHDHTMTRAEADAMGITKEKNKESGEWQVKFNWKANPTGMLSNNTGKSGVRLWYPECLLIALGQAQIPDADVVDAQVVEAQVVEVVAPQAQEARPAPVVVEAPKNGNGHTEQPAQGNGGAAPHWTRTGEAGAFMKRMAEKTGLSYATVQEAMGVKAITQYTGTIEQAEKAIDDWVFEQSRKA